MKRKILSLVLCGCMVAGMFPAVALAEDSQGTSTATPVVTAETTEEAPTSGQCGDNLTWSYDEGSKTLTISGTGDMWDYEPGDRSEWTDVASNIDVVHVVLEKGITSIGDRAFDLCANMTEIVIPDGVTTIGEEAFNWCDSLTKITIPESITSIGKDAFYHCENLDTIFFGGTTEAWKALDPDFMDYNPYSVTIVCADATIPVSETSGTCGDNLTWNYNENTQTLTISGTGDMWDYSWADKASWMHLDVSQVILEEGVTSIGGSAFFYCFSLSEVVFPDSLTSIGEAAFYGCEALTEITLPENVSTIGNSTFFWCTSLTDITLSKSITSIGQSAFSGCENLTSVNYTGTQEQWESIAISGDNECLTSANIHYNFVPAEPTPEPTPTPTPEPTPTPSQKPEETTPPTTGGETTAPDKVDVTVSGDKAEATVGGVALTLDNAGKVFESGTVITVEKVTQGETYEAVKKALAQAGATMDGAAVLEFTATKDGKPVQPDGALSVTFAIPEGLTASNLKLFYVSPDGKYEEVKITVDPDARTVTANLTHFSTYVLANVARSANDGNGVPQTGDTSALTLYVCVLAMSMAGLTILLVNKRRA